MSLIGDWMLYGLFLSEVQLWLGAMAVELATAMVYHRWLLHRIRRS